jgi:hypothetical protein
LIPFEIKKIQNPDQAVVREFDPVFSGAHVQTVIVHKEVPWPELNRALRVQDQKNLFSLDHIEDKQGRVFTGQVDFLNAIPQPLSEVISVFIFPNAGMEGIDDLPVFEFPLLLVAPKALLVQKKGRLFLGDDDFRKWLFHGIVYLSILMQALCLNQRLTEPGMKDKFSISGHSGVDDDRR